jgi:hypothetical protein
MAMNKEKLGKWISNTLICLDDPIIRKVSMTVQDYIYPILERKIDLYIISIAILHDIRIFFILNLIKPGF